MNRKAYLVEVVEQPNRKHTIHFAGMQAQLRIC